MIDESARTWKKWVSGKRCFLGESGVGCRPLPGTVRDWGAACMSDAGGLLCEHGDALCLLAGSMHVWEIPCRVHGDREGKPMAGCLQG